VPQKRLVPIALLRSCQCERDDHLLRTTGEDNRRPEPVRLRASTVTSVSRSLPAGTAPHYRGRDHIRALPKMVSKPMPRYVALHRSGSAKPPRRRAGLLKTPSECGSSRIAAKGGEGSPGMAAGRSPFSEVPPKTDCQPEVGRAVRWCRARDADLSARRLNRTGRYLHIMACWPPPGGRGGRDVSHAA
jgi:hypothetical protein